MVIITGALQTFFSVVTSERSERSAWSALEYMVEDMKREISLGSMYKLKSENELHFQNQFSQEVTYKVDSFDEDYGILKKSFMDGTTQEIFASNIRIKKGLFYGDPDSSDNLRVILQVKLQYIDGEGIKSYIPKGGSRTPPIDIQISKALF